MLLSSAKGGHAPVKTRFPYDFGPEALNLATYSTLAGSFFNRNTVTPLLKEGGSSSL